MFAFPSFVVMQSDITKSVAKGFEDIEATADKGGDDTAHLRDLTSADNLVAEGDLATLTTPNYSVKVKSFETVNAEATDDEDPPSTDISDIDFVLASEGDWLTL